MSAALPTTRLEVLGYYARCYPRTTAVFVALNAIAAAATTWSYGITIAVCSAVAYALFAIGFKFLVLLLAHDRLFAFPRKNLTVFVAALAIDIAATAASYPLLHAAPSA